MRKVGWFPTLFALSILGFGTGPGCSDDSGTGPGPVCGNGKVEGQEDCDGEDLGAQTCESLGLGGGSLSCKDDCTFDVSECEKQAECGNGLIEYPEECDGTELGGKTCQDLGYAGGVLSCSSSCTFDVSRCEGGGECGNGRVESGEECDGDDLGGQTCESLGLGGGSLACSDDCTFDVTGCYEQAQCGDGVVEYPEECDGDDLGSETCETLGYYGGDLACTSACTFDVSGCQGTCGDGQVDEGHEQCDGDDLGGQTCESLGFSGGTLACASDCTFDTSGCEGTGPFCGNGVVEGLEECDGTDLNGETCESQGYHPGQLGCASDCTFDFSGCGGQCGDGILQSDYEECDGTDFGGESCEARGYYGGQLACRTDCTIDDSGCTGTCGDGIRNGPEECDGTDLGGATCESLGHAGGELSCNGDCTLNTDGCFDEETDCSNGQDDDQDGLTDCEDGDCDTDPSCAGVCVPDGGALTCGDHVTGNLGPMGHDRVDSWCSMSGYEGPEMVYTGENPSRDAQVVDVRLWNNTADLDVFVLVDEGSGCSGNLPCAGMSHNADTSMEQFRFTADPGTAYFLAVDGWRDATGPYDLAVNCLADEIRAVYEVFSRRWNPFDLAGVELEFHPDAQAPNGYTWDATPNVSDYLLTPGTGDVSSRLITQFDREYVEVDLSGSVTFYGQTYNKLFVSENGYVTFVAPDNVVRPDTAVFFSGPPRVAGHWIAMNVETGGAIFVDEYGDGTVVVSYVNVAVAYGNTANSFQIVFWPTGDVGIVNLSGATSGLVGLSEGFGQNGPGSVDLSVPNSPPQTVPGYYEFFEGNGDVFDLNSTIILFTPNPNRPEGYDVRVSQTTLGCPVQPGSGQVSTPLLFFGSDTYQYVSLTGTVRVFGDSFDSIFVGSNGYVTFGRGDSGDTPSPQAHFALERVSGLFTDLDPTAGGQVIVDETWTINDPSSYTVTVSYWDVPLEVPVGPTIPVRFQIVLSATGSISLCYENGGTGPLQSLVGISSGRQGTLPPETDFSSL